MRNTSTKNTLEAMVSEALLTTGYQVSRRTCIGTRPGGSAHKIDMIAQKDNQNILISLKWQQAQRSAEQNIPFEIICLAEAEQKEHGERAYLVLGGNGWTLRDYFVSGQLAKHLIHSDLVEVVTIEQFISLANNASL